MNNLPDNADDVPPKDLWIVFLDSDRKARFTPTYVRSKKNPENKFFEKVLLLTENLPEKASLLERLEFLRLELTEPPKCDCGCGATVGFDAKTNRYSKTASNVCKMKVHNKAMGENRKGKTAEEILGAEKAQEANAKRIASLTGVKQDPERVAKVQAGLDAWRKRNLEQYGTVFTPEQLEAMKGRPWTQLDHLTPEEKQVEMKRRYALGAQRHPDHHTRKLEGLSRFYSVPENRFVAVLTRIKNGTAYQVKDRPLAKEHKERVITITDFSWEFYRGMIPGAHLDRSFESGNDLDHILSCFDGFQNLIHPWIIGHPCNLQVVAQKENRSKNFRSGHELEDLLKKIEAFDALVGKPFSENFPPEIAFFTWPEDFLKKERYR